MSWFTSHSGHVQSGSNSLSGPVPERTEFSQTTLHLRGPLPWGGDSDDPGGNNPLSFNLLIPRVEIDQLKVASGQRLSLQGLGDVSAYVEGQTNDNWGWLAGMKFPTGDEAQRPGPGLVPPSLLQLGSGTFDPIFGLRYLQDDGGQLVKFASGLLIFPIDESDGGLRAGRTLRFNAGGYWRTGQWWNPSMQLEALKRDPDRLDSSTLSDTGATLWTLIPALTANLGASSFVQVSWRLPLTQDVNGTQLVPGTGFTIEGGIRF
jgi:hypothetical protein